MSTTQIGESDKYPSPGGGVGSGADEPIPAPKKKFDWRPVLFVGPAIVLLAIIIGYPITRAVYLSFLADQQLDPETGRFVTGGFAGLPILGQVA